MKGQFVAAVAALATFREVFGRRNIRPGSLRQHLGTITDPSGAAVATRR